MDPVTTKQITCKELPSFAVWPSPRNSTGKIYGWTRWCRACEQHERLYAFAGWLKDLVP
jgi:hypothetical protein